MLCVFRSKHHCSWKFHRFYRKMLVFEFFLSLKTVIMLIFICICIKQSQHLEMKKNNSKLNFTKKCWASWFSCGQLKISKCSLTRLGECSKRRLHYREDSRFTFAIRQKSWEPFWEMMDPFVLVAYASLTASVVPNY